MFLSFNLFQSSFFSIIVLNITFLSIWLDHEGYDKNNISKVFLILAISRLVTFFCLFFFVRKIKIPDDKKILYILTLIFFLSWGFFTVQNLLIFSIFIFLNNFFLAFLGPLLEAFISKLAKGIKKNYALIRRWGTLAFLLATLIFGFLFDYISIANFPFIFISLVGSGFIFFVIFNNQYQKTFLARRQKTSKEENTPITQNNVIILIIAFLLMGSHAGHLNYASLIWNKQGWNLSTIGILGAIGVIAEFIFFSFKKINFGNNVIIKKALFWGIVLTSLRWVIQGFFLENIIVQFICQLLHAFSFGLNHLLIISYMKTNLKESQFNHFQGSYFLFSFGLGFASYTYVTNYLFIHVSNFSLYGFSALGSLLTLLFLYFLKTESVLKKA